MKLYIVLLSYLLLDYMQYLINKFHITAQPSSYYYCNEYYCDWLNDIIIIFLDLSPRH